MRIVALTQAGVGKQENEDRIVVGKTILANGTFQCEAFFGVIAIADGVGGNNAGAVASHFVANRLGELVSFDKSEFERINHDLIALSKTDDRLYKMATTLSAVYCNDNLIKCFYVGNTRIYALQSGKYLKQLTEDDTTLNHLLKTGQLTQEDAEAFAGKNEIISCFGAGDERLFNIKTISLSDSGATTFLVTSDGIHDYVTIDELEDIIEEENDNAAICQQITKKAVSNGSQDDISVLIAIL